MTFTKELKRCRKRTGVKLILVRDNASMLVDSGADPLLTADRPGHEMGMYSLCFHRQNIRIFVDISPAIFGR